MEMVIESAGAVSSRVRLGAHELVFDQPGSVPGGDDRGPSPLDVLAASVGACAHYFAAAYLYARRLPTAEVRVEVHYEKSRDPAPRISSMQLRVRVPDGLSNQNLAAIERSVRSCPAYNTLLHTTDLKLEIGPEPALEETPSAPRLETPNLQIATAIST